jgi:glycine cleavage system H protein
MYPDQYLYHAGHEWVFAQGEICTIGITDFAQSEMEEIVFIELPQVGQTFEACAAIGSVESIKAVAEIYTPIGGEVVEINRELLEWPAFLNEDPHGKGWMIKLRLSSPGELDQLMTVEEYKRHIQVDD